MERPYKGKWLVLPVLLIALCFLSGAFAQEMTAGLQGTVKDPSGASVANATVEISGASLIGSKKFKTDESGTYHVTQLPGGVYTLTVTVPGFRSFKQVGIDLAVGRLPSVDVKLEVGAVAETVEVSSDASVVDVTQSKVQVNVSRTDLDALPQGRSFQSVIPFAAGARQEPLQGGANGFQVDGASNGENVYLIDGVNTTNILTGGVGKSFQMDFVEEVQVKSSSFEAEYGGALGGVINALGKRGSNNWHGSMVSYFQSNALSNNNGDRALRINPATSRNTTTRIDGTPEYFSGKPDQRSIVEPGYTVGGALMKNKLWIFSSYIPSVDTTRRITNFTGPNPGPRTLTQTTTTQNAYDRLDYGVTSNLRLFASWNYGYFRTTGTLGGQDSNYGQRDTTASTDPNTLRSDAGSVNPLSVYSFGGDWTPTAKLVVSARYGYFFQNTESRGIPTGNRYLYGNSVSASTVDLQGNPMPSSLYNTSGFANIPSTNGTIYNAYKRKSINADASYFVGHLAGTHSFKGGFFYQTQSNDILKSFNGGFIELYLGNSAFQPSTSTTACDAVKAQNLTNYGKSACQGLYGYFTVGGNGTLSNTGGSSQTAKAIYFQDTWQVGHGLTLNLGVRLDNEIQPPYDPTRFPTVQFGWGKKIAPRLGGAYDVLHNGKVKIYASYGQFYDIMKMGLAQGSFGSDYWHDCVYALDTTNYAAITPTWPIGGGCPATGPAPGVSIGRFIENQDWRATKADPRDPAIATDMNPMKQHEYVMGVDWAVTPNWSIETRYSRKRLDQTIEDMSITDSLGYYIGNPGSLLADVMHRPVSIPCQATPGFNCTPGPDGNYYNTTPFCAECPPVVKAVRRYDGAEISLAKRASGKWFGKVTYTYSKLAGNYPGLTNSDPTDGGTSGRLSPNNSRLFDLPTMTYLPSGKIDDGVLSTDRPHTGKAFGFYRLKSKLGETLIGVTQSAFQGTPLNTCVSVMSTGSACQWGEGRGNFAKLSRSSTGDIVKDGVVNNARSDPFIQTDISIHHEIPVHEGMRMEFEGNIINVFNQRAVLGVSELVVPTGAVAPVRASRFAGDPNIDFGKLMNGYNYIDALNGTGAFAGGIQPKLTLASLYGMPNSFQTGRAIRLAVRFVF